MIRHRLEIISIATVLLILLAPSLRAEFKAGAALTDITPEKMPVIVNGGTFEKIATGIHTRLHARSICLSDGQTELAIVVVDTCMLPRKLLDECKALANKATGIPVDRMLIAATHAHSAPACMGCLGTLDADPTYVPFIRNKLVQAIAVAQRNLVPARIGMTVVQTPVHTALRRWIRRSDRIAEDPFGDLTVRANMHAANNWDDVTGESGPEDPDLSIISIQSRAGRPLAVLANFSMHYFSDKALSADYYGLYSQGLAKKLAPESPEGKAPFVGMMSHGCSGDIWLRDYAKPLGQRREKLTISQYADELVNISLGAIRNISYKDDITLDMAETRLHLDYRVPDRHRLEWAQRVVKEMGDRPPKTRTEVYAREQIFLSEWQSTDVVVQAVRIGNFALATTPTETYALTGLKIKAHSPLQPTVVFDLTNGGDGYIPPPEQHLLGGYNTWPARSAGLEVQAEPKIVEAAITLLEQVSGKPRRKHRLSRGPATEAILKTRPDAYFRMDEFSASRAIDSSGNHLDAIYEPGVVFYLQGPHSKSFCKGDEKNRAAHFAGGRLRTRVPGLGKTYSFSLWFWNGMPDRGRGVTGWIASRSNDHALGHFGDHLGIAGTSTPDHTGKILFFHGADESGCVFGKTVIDRWTWNHLALVRDGETVRAYLNGSLEIESDAPTNFPEALDRIFFGGRSDSSSNFEGRIDEIAIYRRTLSEAEIKTLSNPD